MMEMVWYSHNDIDKCVANLKSSINNSSWFSGNSSGSIGGKIKGYKFQLWKRQIQYHNSFSSIFYGNLISDGNGTRILGRFALNSIVKGFLIFWYGFVIILGSLFYISTLTNWIPGAQHDEYIPPIIYGTPFLFILFAYGLTKIGTWFGKMEQKNIIDFLEVTLKAHKLN